jgi:nucleobase transporter 1/2
LSTLGHYLAGAPVPPPGLVCRGIALQGVSCILAGLWGTASGTTAINENISAMSITRVGSRRVMHVAALCALVMGLIGEPLLL